MNDYKLDGVGKNERKPVLLTDYQAKFLDYLLFKEQSYKRKRGIKWIDEVYQEHGCSDYDDFVDRLKETIVNQTNIEYSYEQQEEMNRIQGRTE
jgi:hypothetical protein